MLMEFLVYLLILTCSHLGYHSEKHHQSYKIYGDFHVFGHILWLFLFLSHFL